MNTRPTQQVVAHVRRKAAACRAALVVAAVLLLASAQAFAQEYQKIEGKTTQDVSSPHFMAFAYAFIWIAVLAYVVVVARGLARVKREIAMLRDELKTGPRRDAEGGS